MKPALRTVLGWVMALLAPLAFAQPYPNKPLHLVVPFAAGGGTDLVARVLGEGMGRELGQQVIIDNKPGGGTIIGTDAAAKSPADGYTLLMGTFAYAVNPSLQPKLPYSQTKSFAPVALIGRSPNVWVVRPDRPYKSVADVLAYARANPGKLTYGSYGSGTSAHLAAELMKSLAKVDITHVPYKGSAPAITDLLGGQIDMILTTIASAAPYVSSGKLRALAVTSATRSPTYPDVPTVAEAGIAGYVAESWYGLYVPAGTPAEVIAKLNAAAKAASLGDAFKKRVQDEGLVLTPGTPADLDRYVTGEEARWRKIVQDAHITAE
jgi:tripartite-type tricarboxylate transporter receptor subunit TctC